MKHDKGYSLAGKRVFVAGHRGMVGSALCRRLAHAAVLQTIGRDQLDLRCQPAVDEWFAAHRPQVVFLAAAKVGGITANASMPAEFIYDNLAIQTNVIDAARRTGVEKFLFLGSSCVYPRLAHQPVSEDALLTGSLEPTNESYAVAKISGLKLCQAYRRQYGLDFISVIPAGLYGAGDTFDAESSHVIAALILKLHDAKIAGSAEVTLWGSGKALREFMYVDDFADAAIFLMRHYSDDLPINVGSGEQLTILELAKLIAEIVGWNGRFVMDTSKPDGMPRKCLDSTRLKALGWRPRVALADGVRRTYEWFLSESWRPTGHMPATQGHKIRTC
jgi:GDP-L-fucose synthase